MKTPDLKTRILAFLATVEEATAKQIARALDLVNYPSLVATALNALRTDAAIECEKKKGKGNELWYWLTDIGQRQAGATENGISTPAAGGVVTAAGEHQDTRVAGGMKRAAPPPEGSPVVEPPKPEQAPAEASSNETTGSKSLDIALRNHNLITRICIAAGFAPDADLDALPEHLGKIAGRVAELELAVDAAQQTIASMELEAEQAAGSAVTVESAARGYLVCAPKRKPAKLTKADSAIQRAKTAAKTTGRAEVFALVPVGVAKQHTKTTVEFSEAA